MKDLFVGHDGSDRGWIRLLDQERIDHRADLSDATVVVLSGRIPDWAAAYVERGGVAVVSGAEADDPLLPDGVEAVITRFTRPDLTRVAQAPCLATLFDAPGTGELRLHEDRVVKYDRDVDVHPAVLVKSFGAGHLVVSGVPLTRLLTSPGDRLRAFSEFDPVTERVATSDKAEVADTLLDMLDRGFALAGAPLVTADRFPDGAASTLVLRVDVDGVYGDRAQRIADAVTGCGMTASFYLNGDYSKLHPGELRGLTRAGEVGQHGWLHTLLQTRHENVDNLERAAHWMRAELDLASDSFVAPRGMWNRALGAALQETGHRYSSDFGLDFDSLPFRADGGILQVPVHPYSPERHVVWAAENGHPRPTPDDVVRHYRAVVCRQVALGRPAHVYGHPEVLGEMADVVVPALAALASSLAITSSTLGDFADFWIARESLTARAALDDSHGRLVVDLDAAAEVSVGAVVSGATGLEVSTRSRVRRNHRLGRAGGPKSSSA